MYGPKWPFLLMYMSHDIDVGTGCIWVELLVQRRLCPIFMRPRLFRRLKGCQRTPGFWGVTEIGPCVFQAKYCLNWMA